jgi:hypothetical protein
MCTKGKTKIGNLEIVKGETVLIPAMMREVILLSEGNTNILEIWVN